MTAPLFIQPRDLEDRAPPSAGDEYPQTAEIESRCVNILSRLWNAPDADQATGCSTTGSNRSSGSTTSATTCPTFALNFSRQGTQVVAQYYNFIRLGFEGYYRKVQGYARDVAAGLVDRIAEAGPFRARRRGWERLRPLTGAV